MNKFETKKKEKNEVGYLCVPPKTKKNTSIPNPSIFI